MAVPETRPTGPATYEPLPYDPSEARRAGVTPANGAYPTGIIHPARSHGRTVWVAVVVVLGLLGYFGFQSLTGDSGPSASGASAASLAGSSQPLPAAAIKRGNAICASGERRGKALGPIPLDRNKPRAPQLPAAARYLRKASDIMAETVRQLTALARSNAPNESLDEALRLMGMVVVQFRAATRHARVRDVAGFAQALAPAEQYNHAANVALTAAGLDYCGKE
jgi:hypothetical protein